MVAKVLLCSSSACTYFSKKQHVTFLKPTYFIGENNFQIIQLQISHMLFSFPFLLHLRCYLFLLQVSRASRQFLRLMHRKPILDLEKINPTLFDLVPQLAHVRVFFEFIFIFCLLILLQRKNNHMVKLRVIEDNGSFFLSVPAYRQFHLNSLQKNFPLFDIHNGLSFEEHRVF